MWSCLPYPDSYSSGRACLFYQGGLPALHYNLLYITTIFWGPMERTRGWALSKAQSTKKPLCASGALIPMGLSGSTPSRRGLRPGG